MGRCASIFKPEPSSKGIFRGVLTKLWCSDSHIEMWHISPVHGQPVPQIKPISKVGYPVEVWRDHTAALLSVTSILLGEDEKELW